MPFNVVTLARCAHSATRILVSMPRISRRALPVATVTLARYLIGKRLVHQSAAGRIAGRIVETEAYPPGDPTGYARPGLTTSNTPLFAVRGTAYVRMVYGACLTLNLASEVEGVGAAVLIRALEPTEGIALMLANRPGSRLRDLARGPGRVCAALGIGRELSGADLCSTHPRCGWSACQGSRRMIQVDDAHRAVARSASPVAFHRARQPFRERSAIMRAMRCLQPVFCVMRDRQRCWRPRRPLTESDFRALARRRGRTCSSPIAASTASR